MNEYAILIGISTALLTILFFNRGNLPGFQILYAWYLATFPLYYWFFSLFSGDSMVIIKEIMFGLPFILLAGVSVKLQRNNFSRILASGYILHAGYVFYHSSLFVNPGVPNWWPEFSGVIELVLGLYIALFIFARNSLQNQVISTGVCNE